MFTARVFNFEIERALLFWWYVIADYCGGDHGFYGPGAKLHDVPAVRLLAEEGKL